MPRISIAHPDLGPQKTYLTSDIVATAVLSLVENNDGFAADDLVILGKPGEEKSEIVTLTGVTGNSQLDHSAGTIFGHPARTPIYEVGYNQACIYRATAEGGSYSLIATIDLDIDEVSTMYDDADGTQASWYKVRYKNSVLTTYSDYTDEIQGSGYTDSSLSTLTDSVLEEFGDVTSQELSRNQVRTYLNDAIKKTVIAIIKTYPDFRTTYTTQALTANTATYSLPTNFLAFKRIDVNYTGSTATEAIKATFEGEESGYPSSIYQTNSPRVYIRGTSFGLRPTPTASGGYAFIWYWDYPTALDNESDEHGLPYGAEECLVFYALYRAWLSKNQEKSDRYKRAYEDSLEQYTDFVGQQRQLMDKKKVRIVFGSDLYEF